MSDETPSPEAMKAGISEAIEAIRSVIQMDGGDIHLVSLDAQTGVVQVELSGACVGCPASTMTLKAGVERILMDRVPGVTRVDAVGMEPEYEAGDETAGGYAIEA